MRAVATRGASSPVLELRGLAKQYGPVTAVHPLDLDFGRGEFLAILGPSGCGKTTLLRMIGGFVEPSAGSIIIDGEDVTRRGPNRRPTNMVFQGYGLFPHMTVAQNIAYGLHIAKRPRPEIAERVAEAMALVHMEDFGDRPVTQLSGGQAQRVALARALVMRPKVLLLDEPLAALDLKLRKAMQQELRSLHAATGGTFVFVTHDQEEAMGLASRICVMESGSIIQNGSPEEIYSHPRSRFVSTFIGEANMLRGTRRANQVRLATGACFADEGPNEAVVCVVRPEKLMLNPAEPGAPFPAGALVHKGILEDAVFLGPFVKYSVRLDNGDTTTIDSHDMELRRRLQIGQPVLVAWRPGDQRVLPDR
jgi:spermidine/putrescine ABC transporter ATP-binding subunit